MTTKHLDDEEVQQYALNGSSGNDMLAHIHSCTDCRARVEAYRLLIKAIEQQPVPVFDFDLEELVLSQLPAPVEKKTVDNVLAWVFILPAVLLGALVIYLSRNYFHGFFAGISMLVIGLVTVSAIVIVVVLCIDMYKTYKKKINSLDLY